MLRGWLVLLILVAVPRAATAQAPSDPVVDPDTEASRRHFESGLQLYDQQRYREAIVEFQAANDLQASPALDYNVGRCYERLEEWGAAAAAYDRYLSVEKSSLDAVELRARMDVLRARVARVEAAKAEAARAEAASRRRRKIAVAVALGGLAVAGAVAGLAVRLSMFGAFSDLQTACAKRQCLEGDLDDLRARDAASIALFAVAGAAAIADVIYLLATRRSADQPRAWIAPSLHGLVAGGSF